MKDGAELGPAGGDAENEPAGGDAAIGPAGGDAENGPAGGDAGNGPGSGDAANVPARGDAAAAPPRDGAPTARRRRRLIPRRWIRPGGEVAFLIVLALAVRVCAWAARPAILPDSVDLLDAAERVARDGWPALFHISHHPLPVLLASWIPAGQDAETWASLAACVFSALAVGPLHVVARCAAGRHAATMAGLLYAVLPKFVSIGSLPLAEPVFLPLFAAAFSSSLVAAVGRTPRRRVGRAALSGALAAFACLARPEGFVAGAAIAVAAAVRSRRGERLRAGIVAALAFAAIAGPYVAELSSVRRELTLSPKKHVAEFVGLDAAPKDAGRANESSEPAPVERNTWTAVASGVHGVGDALVGALGPALLLVVIGAFPRTRWRRARSGSARGLLVGTALVLCLALARLQTGWDYAGGRHALAAATVLLPFAGEGMVSFVAFLSRAVRRRRAALALTTCAVIPLAVTAILRPDGESGARERSLGELIAQTERDAGGRGDVIIGSFREPLVAFYADRALRADGRRARNVRLPKRRFGKLLSMSADLDARRAELVATLRAAGATWLVVPYLRRSPVDEGTSRRPGEELAALLIADGEIAPPAIGAAEFAAFRLVPR